MNLAIWTSAGAETGSLDGLWIGSGGANTSGSVCGTGECFIGRWWITESKSKTLGSWAGSGGAYT